MSTVISLCDYTGNMVDPWLDAGHDAILVDPQHLHTRMERRGRGTVTYLALTVEEALREPLPTLMAKADVGAVFAFPPCTDLAVSGARWFEAKRAADPLFQARAVAVAEQCRTIGAMSGAPWMVENPVSVLSSVWGPPQHIFHPYEYASYYLADNYTKKTCLWVGAGFKMPEPTRNVGFPPPDNRIHAAGESKARANFRSATPIGFARAVYLSNAPARIAS